MQKAQAGDTVEPLDDLRMPRVVQIEQHVAVGREPVGEEHLSGSELVLGVMRPETLFADGRRRHDGPMAIAVSCEVDDREEVAVLPVLVAGPGNWALPANDASETQRVRR